MRESVVRPSGGIDGLLGCWRQHAGSDHPTCWIPDVASRVMLDPVCTPVPTDTAPTRGRRPVRASAEPRRQRRNWAPWQT